MKFIKPYLLIIGIVLSTIFFMILGGYWNQKYYHESEYYSFEKPSLSYAFMGFHDGYHIEEMNQYMARSKTSANVAITDTADTALETSKTIGTEAETQLAEPPVALASDTEAETAPDTYSFTSVTADYFNDAVFIGDSRTVGICEYSGIENATFLCKTSLTIYDYDKPKIEYNNEKTSIQDVLEKEQFGKIYLMVGINECSYGTPESFYALYKNVVDDIRKLQPNALIFIEGNLFVTQEKSDENTGITNENITSRNELIATLANQKDTFYIDINQSSLCADGALVSDYTWDQIHVKAQYYEVWKDYLLEHGIIIENDSI